MEPDDFMVAWTTCPDVAAADRLAGDLVSARLAACVTVIPTAVSVYRWQGEVNRNEECVLMIKARRSAWPDLEAAVRVKHPYEVPELIAVPLAAGSRPYLEWLETSTR